MKKTFTIVELLIVISIIAIIMAIILPRLVLNKYEKTYVQIIQKKKGEIDPTIKTNLIKELKTNKEFKERMVEKHGHWKGVTDTGLDVEVERAMSKNPSTIQHQSINKKELDSEVKRALSTEIKELKKEISLLKESKLKPYKYEIKDKRDLYGWKYSIVRNGEEVLICNDKQICEKMIQLFKDSFQNGLDVATQNKETQQ